MSRANHTTIQSYDTHLAEYINGTPQQVSGDIKKWIDDSFAGLPLNARILEIGSAFGRDAKYIEGLGYTVDRTDATPGFVALLKKQNYSVRLLNILNDDVSDTYDVVFANAVLLHFTPEEMLLVLRKILACLSLNGSFMFTLKQGRGDKWSERKLGAPRYFCYWESSAINELLHKIGFSHIKLTESTDNKWLHIVAKK